MPHLLIVEDDPMISRMYLKIFRELGYMQTLAQDGEEGLKLALQIIPDLILLDIMMPKMNGVDVLHALQRDPTTQHIPVVMLTNVGSTQDVESAFQQGAIKYLIKSEYEPQQVADIVKEILQA